jgi:hypothetical protein
MATLLQASHLLRAAQRRGRSSVRGRGGTAHPTIEGQRGANVLRHGREKKGGVTPDEDSRGGRRQTPVAADGDYRGGRRPTETPWAADGGLQATVIESGEGRLFWARRDRPEQGALLGRGCFFAKRP